LIRDVPVVANDEHTVAEVIEARPLFGAFLLLHRLIMRGAIDKDRNTLNPSRS
jgi:hypothetical protein